MVTWSSKPTLNGNMWRHTLTNLLIIYIQTPNSGIFFLLEMLLILTLMLKTFSNNGSNSCFIMIYFLLNLWLKYSMLTCPTVFSIFLPLLFWLWSTVLNLMLLETVKKKRYIFTNIMLLLIVAYLLVLRIKYVTWL